MCSSVVECVLHIHKARIQFQHQQISNMLKSDPNLGVLNQKELIFFHSSSGNRLELKILMGLNSLLRL